MADRKEPSETSDVRAYKLDFERRETSPLRTNAEIQEALAASQHVEASL